MRNKGITLIALVVTIVVLLILVAVTINLVFSDDGIIAKARQSEVSTDIGWEKEQISVAFSSAYTDKQYNNWSRITAEIFEPILEEQCQKDVNVVEYGDDLLITYVDTNRTYRLTEGGEITEFDEKVNDVYPGDITDNGELNGKDKPYKISCVEDWIAFCYTVNGISVNDSGELQRDATNSYSYLEETVVLNTNLGFNLKFSYIDSETKVFGDINENGIVEGLQTELSTGKGLIVLGMYETDFKGTLDGQNYTLSGIYMNRSEEELIGLIGVNNGHIRNLKTQGRIIEGAYVIGGIAGDNYGTIENCYNEIQIECNAQCVAGITGYNESGAEIIQCSNLAEISGYREVGGIAGWNCGTIEECYNSATIRGIRYHIGGISGRNQYGSNNRIKNCYNTGEIYGETALYVGGIIGSMNVTNGGSVANSYNTGTVHANNSSYGAIAGAITYTNVTRCYALEGTFSIICKDINNGSSLDNLTGFKTEDELKSEEILNSLNETNEETKWKRGENGYPILYWQ